LPEGALIDKISAEYKNGILKVIIPVKPQNQGRDINIK
jgi:HSP20 family molecular chaperone IbpA